MQPHYFLLWYLWVLPLPRFNPPKVGLNASQLGHINLRFCSTLFRQFPSIWSATNGDTLVVGLISDQLQTTHLLWYFSLRKRLIWLETIPVLWRPISVPFCQSKIYFLYSKSCWHLLLQYLHLTRLTKLLQFKHFCFLDNFFIAEPMTRIELVTYSFIYTFFSFI